MRVTPATHRSHGAAILRAAAALFRARGIGPVTVADVTQHAGLTHGAFYGHYPSKAALAGAACRSALQSGAARWRERAAQARAEGGDGLTAIIDAYLTEQHRDETDSSCAIVALGPEMVRGDPALRSALADGATALLEVLDEEIARLRPDMAAAPLRTASLGVLAALTGGLLLARACADAAESRTALAAASRTAQAAARL